ncbi:MAG TPA: polymer-forming cytoskeletal protein [Chloroflexia bacterium]|nr:polymer-forming cytoskeletal protein [Chloroflexia bacterium]
MSSIFGNKRGVAAAPRPVEDKIETLIGSTSRLHGDIKTEGTIRIDGVIEGDVESASNIIVGQNGKVLGSLRAQKVLVAGAVRGNIQAAGGLEIVATGKVWGDITITSLLIEEGGLFRGQSIMRDEPPPEALLAPTVLAVRPVLPPESGDPRALASVLGT